MRYTDQPELSSGPAGWLAKTLAIMAMAALVLIILAAARQPQTASAHGTSFYLECPTTQVKEGGSVDVTLVWDSGYHHRTFGAKWHTDSGTAGTSDYVHQDTDWVWANDDDASRRRTDRTVQTRQDSAVEINETFTIRFSPTSNVVDINDPDKDHKCEITIIDDDFRITGLNVISSPARDETYGVGETIEIEATFSADIGNVDTEKSPGLEVLVGSNWRSAGYLRQSADNKLVFGYTVKSEDRDDDGFSMKDSLWHNFLSYTAITANGPDYSDVPVSWEYTGLGTQSGHKVNGSLTPVGTKTEIASSPAKYGVYRHGETIEIDVTFSAPLEVEGSRNLDLRMGDSDNWWRGASYKSGSGTKTLTFGYTVQSHDYDADGLGMLGTYTSGGQLHGLGGSGKVKVAGTDKEVYPTFSGLENQPLHKVDGRPYAKNISITSTPAATDNTYGLDEVIQVSVDFGQNVTASSDTTVTLKIGNAQGHAAYVSGNGTPVLVFEYTVAADDRDANGIDVFVPHGKDIKATGTNVAYTATVAEVTPLMGEAPSHKVNGSLVAADTTSPTISSVKLTSSYFGDKQAYGAGDRIQATVTFDEEVLVTGTPKLRLNIGGQTKTASYWNRGSGIASEVAIFRYYAVEGDSDSNGISIAANSIVLDGGTIKDEADNDAVLTHEAVADNSDHKVDAPDATGPTVSSVAITSDAGEDDTYVAGDTIEFSVRFNENIAVTGGPKLTFNLGDGSRTADYSSHDGATIVFTYTVAVGDVDDDGISVDSSSSLALNGGTIKDAASNDANLALNNTIANSSSHKVLAPGGV